MEIIEKIQLLMGDKIDEQRLVSIEQACSQMMIPIELDLIFLENDQNKLNIIQSKLREVQDKIKENFIKSQYAIFLYNLHLEIEFKKLDKDQPFNIPIIMDETSIFKEKVFRIPDSEDEYNEMDHVECALIEAQKVCEASIVWTIFYSELEDLEIEVKKALTIDNEQELARNSQKEIPVKKKLKEEESNEYSRDCQRIFKGYRGRKIFEYLQANLVSGKNKLADYTFIFRRMQKDGYIYDDIKEKTFREFLSRNFKIEISSNLKPDGYNITDLKEKMYSNVVHSTQNIGK